MNNNNLSKNAAQQIDKMVERVARKAGYTGKENMSYKDILQEKFERKRKKLNSKINKYKTKFGLGHQPTDFTEEIKTYLRDGLNDLIKEGYSEEEALKITMEKFDEAELTASFDEFVDVFGGFGMEHYEKTAQWYVENGEAIGTFYAAFTVLGLTIGGFLGYLLGHTLINTAIGLGVGMFIGVGLGLLSHAIITLTKKK